MIDDDIEAYLARGEARFPDLRPHAVKQCDLAR